MGDYHARFCERFKVKLLLSTRLGGRKAKVGRKLLNFPSTRLTFNFFHFLKRVNSIFFVIEKYMYLLGFQLVKTYLCKAMVSRKSPLQAN